MWREAEGRRELKMADRLRQSSVEARGLLRARGNNEDGFHGSGVELFEEAKG